MRTFKLPQRVELIYDLFKEETIAYNSDSFQIELEPISSALYYIGDNKILEHKLL